MANEFKVKNGLKFPDGTVQTTASTGGGSSTITIQNKTAAYTVVAGDNGTIIKCSGGAFTISLTAAATLGAGFSCWVWNTNTDANAITIDPNASETIDFIPTLVLRQGEGLQIVCDGTNWHTGSKKAMRGYADNIYPTNNTRPIASAWNTVAIGYSSDASTTNSMAVGHGCKAANEGFSAGMGSITSGGIRGTALGYNPKATGDYAVALGSINTLGSIAAGNNSMSVGGSYASGASSFAAVVANNTSSYGATGDNAVAIGNQAKASSGDAFAFGVYSQATANYSSAFGRGAKATALSASVLGGYNGQASAEYSLVIGGTDGKANANYSTVIGGYYGITNNIIGKVAIPGGVNSGYGTNISQFGIFVLGDATTDATAKVLTTDKSTAAATNQVILPNNSAYAFMGTIIARQQAAGGSNYAAWEIKGAIIRDTTAASTSLGSYNINVLSKTAGASTWTVALSADTTNGGLAITVTGAAATNIRWVATIQTSEVTYA